VRPKLTVATTFPIHPPRGGGQQRVFGLYGALAERVDVDIVALVDRDARGGVRTLRPGLREIRVPKTAEHDAIEFRLQQQAAVPVTDVLVARDPELTPAYGEAIAASARDSLAVVASHPFAAPAIPAGVPLIYEAHNVEADLKAAMYSTPEALELLEVVRAVEGECCERAHHVLVCAPGDARRLHELYGLPPERAVAVPNGVAADAHAFAPRALRAQRQARLGLQERFDVLFLGSWHEPNVVAVRDILAAAPSLEGVRLLVVGSAGALFAAQEDLPPNVDICGVLDGQLVQTLLGAVDAAVNPMRFGSGTNLKMLDYAMAGVPIVATAVGARGLDLEPGRHYALADPDDLGGAIAALREEAPEAVDARVEAAHALVRERFTWPSIAARWLASEAMRALISAGVAA
jgi:glycosyltransferase involved in cell wall biosynthesis